MENNPPPPPPPSGLQWMTFDPGQQRNLANKGNRKEVRSAAARASHARRRAERESQKVANDGTAALISTASSTSSIPAPSSTLSVSTAAPLPDPALSTHDILPHATQQPETQLPRSDSQRSSRKRNDPPSSPPTTEYGGQSAAGATAAQKLVDFEHNLSTGDQKLTKKKKKKKERTGGPPLSSGPASNEQIKPLKAPVWLDLVTSEELHGTALFVISTHVNSLGLDGRGGPAQSTCLVLRGQAIRCMQRASSRAATATPEDNDKFALCLAILAGWEKIYGEESFYKAHLNAMRKLDQASVPIEAATDNNIITLMEGMAQAVRDRLAKLQDEIATDGSLTPLPGSSRLSSSHSRTTLPESMQLFDHTRPATRGLLFLLLSLADYTIRMQNAWMSMFELSLLIFAWRPYAWPPKDWKGSTSPEDLEDLALYHIRAGLISVLGAWSYATGTAIPNGIEDGYFRASDSMDVHYTDMLSLQTHYLMGTKFEEAALWSAFIITSTATASLWRPQSLDLLRRLLDNRPDIRDFEGLEDVLRKYSYREVIHKRNCTALYKWVVEKTLPDQDIGLRTLEISMADLWL